MVWFYIFVNFVIDKMWTYLKLLMFPLTQPYLMGTFLIMNSLIMFPNVSTKLIIYIFQTQACLLLLCLLTIFDWSVNFFFYHVFSCSIFYQHSFLETYSLNLHNFFGSSRFIGFCCLHSVCRHAILDKYREDQKFHRRMTAEFITSLGFDICVTFSMLTLFCILFKRMTVFLVAIFTVFRCIKRKFVRIFILWYEISI